MQPSTGRRTAQHLELLHAVLSRGGEYRRSGSAALSLAQLAVGWIDAYAETHIHDWDVLAGMVLVQEPGGWVNDYLGSGKLWKPHAIIATGPGLRDELMNIGRKVLAGNTARTQLGNSPLRDIRP